MCSEASFLNSGFSIYAKEILSRLYATGKYEIAEFASYAVVNDPKDKDIPWSIYANAVNNADPRHAEYTSRTDNMFGRWRFDKTVVDFSSSNRVNRRPPYYVGEWIEPGSVEVEPSHESVLSSEPVFRNKIEEDIWRLKNKK